MRTALTLAALTAIGLLVTRPAVADDEKATSETDFLKHAAMGGLAEVQLGQLATQNAYSPEVRRFGERMARDHTQANQELKAVATAKGVAVPTILDAKHQAMFDHLKGLKGNMFDQAYMKHMVEDHEQDVAEFSKWSKEAKDGQIKAFAAKTLPTLRQHLQEARAVHDKVGHKK